MNVKRQTCALLATLCVAVACGQSSSDAGGAQGGAGGNAAGSSNSNVAGGGSTAAAGSAGMANGQGGAAGASGGSAGAGGSMAGGGTGGSAGAAAGAGGSVAGAGGEAGAGGQAGAGGAQGVGCAGAALCWDFEEGMIPTGWGTTLRPMDFNGSIDVDDTRPHGGTYSLHMAGLSGGTVGQAGGPKKSMQYTLPANFGPILWGRAYVYTTPHRPMSHAGFFNARYPGVDSQGTTWETLDWYEVAVYQENYMSIWHPPEPPGFPEWVKVSDTPLVLDAWTCVEWLFDAENGAEAVPADPQVWLDGVELTWPNEFTFDNTGTDKPDPPPMEKGMNFTMIETGVVMYQGLEVATDWWIDDLAIGPARIGCE